MTDPLIIAHKGIVTDEPENTYAAFDASASRGFGLEADVICNSEGELFIAHDYVLDRITDQSGPIKDKTKEELLSLNFAAHRNRLFRPQQIPTLDGFLARYLPQDVPIILDLRNYHFALPHDAFVKRVLEVVNAHQALDKILFVSHDGFILNQVKKQAPSSRRGQVYSHFMHDSVDSLLIRFLKLPFIVPLTFKISNAITKPEVILVDYEILWKSKFDALKKAGYEVYVWTVNDPRKAKRLLEWGVDGIITEIPEVLREMVATGGLEPPTSAL